MVVGRSAVNTVAPWFEPHVAEARVLHVQTKLHKWASADPGKTFVDLFNLVCDQATLQVAWQRVRANRGSRTTGVDGMTRADVENRIGVDRFLGELRARLKDGSYRPQPVRERSIPKRGGKLRRLGISTLRDRVVQMALKLVLEPIFEPDQYRSSYAYRPGRRAHDAVAEIVHAINNGYQWVIEGDIESCFDSIPHGLVVERVRRRITDRRVIGLVKTFLAAGVLTEMGTLSRSITGTPQGGIVSPLLANLALSVLDERFEAAWSATSRYRNQRSYLRSKGVATYRLVRYSDDFVILVNGTREQVEALHAETGDLLAGYGLRLSEAKTLITHVDWGFDFLGLRIQRRPRVGKTPCAYTFMSKSMLAATKRKVKSLTRRHTLNLSLFELLMAINPVLRGVANYVRYAAVKRTLHYLAYYTWWRVMRWLRAKHPGRTWTWFRRHYFGTDGINEAGVTLFRPDSIAVTRYRYRGAKIATPWNTEQLRAQQAAFRRVHDERGGLERLQQRLVTA
jgi:RNA-directed DNA polymerase